MLAYLLGAGLALFAYLWLREIYRKHGKKILPILIFVAVVLALCVLIATGRIHWVSMIGVFLFGALYRLISIAIRHIPILWNIVQLWKKSRSSSQEVEDTNQKMNEKRALQVLELKKGASKEEIIAAHRKMMQKIHPDRGGSVYLARVVNEARDYLLERL